MRQDEALGENVRDELKPCDAAIPEEDRAGQIDRLRRRCADLHANLVELADGQGIGHERPQPLEQLGLGLRRRIEQDRDAIAEEDRDRTIAKVERERRRAQRVLELEPAGVEPLAQEQCPRGDHDMIGGCQLRGFQGLLHLGQRVVGPGGRRLDPPQAGTTIVPAEPSTIANAWSMAPIAAQRPVASTKRQAASTFGPIDPGGETYARAAQRGSCARSARPSLAGHRVQTAGNVGQKQQRVGHERPWRAAPPPNPCRSRPRRRECRAPRVATTGMPPPPAQMTITPAPDQQLDRGDLANALRLGREARRAAIRRRRA